MVHRGHSNRGSLDAAAGYQLANIAEGSHFGAGFARQRRGPGRILVGHRRQMDGFARLLQPPIYTRVVAPERTGPDDGHVNGILSQDAEGSKNITSSPAAR